jgi:hypothetical protein
MEFDYAAFIGYDGSSRTTRVQLHDQAVHFAKACLHADRVEIVGWTWRGRFKRTILLEHVAQVAWQVVRLPLASLVLHLQTGEVVGLRTREAAKWRHFINYNLDRLREMVQTTVQMPTFTLAQAA